MDTNKVPYIQRWAQGIEDQCGGDMEDTLNPRIDIDKVDWQQSSEHCFIQDAVGDIVNLPRTFLYEHCHDAERCGDDAKRWLIARFADDISLLNFFLNYEKEKNIVLIAAMRMFVILERPRLLPGGSFIASLYFGLQKLDTEQIEVFFRFLYSDGGCVRGIQDSLHSFSEFEQTILSLLESKK